MRIAERIQENTFKMTVIFILFTVLSVKSCEVNAQSKPSFYKGLTASFGTRAITFNSDIPELHNLSVLEEGGNAGVVIGNNAVRARINLAGFYYAAARTPRTINLFETEVLANFYPMRALSNYAGIVDVYTVTGVSYDHMRFFGYYVDQPEGQQINYSAPNEPYLGRIGTTTVTAGIGMEWTVMEHSNSFVHVFSEARYGFPVMTSASKETFENTTVQKYWAVNLGVSFGFFR